MNDAVECAEPPFHLLDDALFKLWKDEVCTMEDVLAKSANPDDLAKRIANAKKGIFEEEGKGGDGEERAGAARGMGNRGGH